jgi:hypothetical protein
MFVIDLQEPRARKGLARQGRQNCPIIYAQIRFLPLFWLYSSLVVRIGSGLCSKMGKAVCSALLVTMLTVESCGSGILYESCNQPRDAYACYVNATRGGSSSPGGPVSPNNNSVNSNGGATLVATSTPGGRVPGGMNPNLGHRIKFLQSHLANPPMPSVTSK